MTENQKRSKFFVKETETLRKYLDDGDVPLNQIDFSTFAYVVMEKIVYLIIIISLIVASFFMGYYKGYSDCIYEWNDWASRKDVSIWGLNYSSMINFTITKNGTNYSSTVNT